MVVALHWSGQVAMGSIRVQKFGSGCMFDMHPYSIALIGQAGRLAAAAVVAAQF